MPKGKMHTTSNLKGIFANIDRKDNGEQHEN
jgi:hypothetical protein